MQNILKVSLPPDNHCEANGSLYVSNSQFAVTAEAPSSNQYKNNTTLCDTDGFKSNFLWNLETYIYLQSFRSQWDVYFETIIVSLI